MSTPTPSTPAAAPAPDDKQTPEPKKPVDSSEPAPTPAPPIGPTGSTITVEQKQFVFGNGVQGYSRYPWRDSFAYNRQDEARHARSFAYDASFVETNVVTLRRDRILFIHGDAATGKQSMALYLADRLHRSREIAGGTLAFKPPRNNEKFDLFKELKSREELGTNVLIFRNILDFGNQGALDFLSNLKNAAAVSNVVRELEKRGIYVIFTATPSSLPHGFAASLPANLCVTLPALSPEALLAGVDAAVDIFFFKNSGYEDLKARVTPELVQQIAEGCKTMSGIFRFVNGSLIAILQGETTVEKAFDDADVLSAWFQRCPESELEAWIYCFVLVIAHSRGSIAEVYFSEFANLYGPIRRQILKWRGIRHSVRPLDEGGLRKRVCATVYRDKPFAQDVIAFEDPSEATRLWALLTSRFQSLLSSLIPVLLRLTEHDSVSIRVKAAQALGRIGVIDSPSMALTWLRNWAGSDSFKDRALAGYLAQGILSTGDEVYREQLLGTLGWFASRPQYVWTAVVAYKQLAEVDLTLAMDKLLDIAESRLAPAFQAGRDIDQQLRQLDTQLSKLNTHEAALFREVLPALGQFYASLLKDEAELAETFKYTLVSLCLSAGFPSVITHLTSWAHGSSGMEALICLVFLQDEGIARELSSRKVVVVNADDNQRITCNAVLASLVDDSGAVRVFADFLKTMYAGLVNFFSLDLSAPLTRLVFEYLKDWVRESLPLPDCRKAMVELTVRLLRSNLTELRQRTFDWLSSEPAMLESEMVQFARDARYQALSEEQTKETAPLIGL
jgi:hypothetical protein